MILQTQQRPGCLDACFSTQEERLDLTEVCRPVDYPWLPRILILPLTENLAAGTGDYTVTEAINDWTSESSDYDPTNPQYSHFTQVVWKSTTQLGCAVVTCPAGSIFDASYGVGVVSLDFFRPIF